MANTKCIAPPHSIVLVSELGRGEVPRSLGHSLVAATSSCIAVGCRSEVDGPTEFTLGSIKEVGIVSPPAFSGVLQTPHRVVVVQTIFNEPILEMLVPSEQTGVSIWLNDPSEPDKIIVGLDVLEEETVK